MASKKQHSTKHAIYDLVNFTQNKLSSQKQVGILFLDLSKAFDNVNHERLLYNCSNIGIRGLPYDWLQSFLRNRQFFVECNKIKTDTTLISKGVPQGSILSPLLFNIYLYDIDQYNNSRIIQYADDTTIILYTDSLDDLKALMENTYIRIKSYFQLNCLMLNDNKTECIVYKNDNYIKCLRLDKTEICPSEAVKYLGIFIDNKLNFHSEANHICKKLCKLFPIIYNVREKIILKVKGSFFFHK